MVTKIEKENNGNRVIDFLWGPHFCVLPKWPDEEETKINSKKKKKRPIRNFCLSTSI